MSFKKSSLRLAAIVVLSASAGALAGGAAMAGQGHMWNALHALQNADAQLRAADADKGGHRVNAINLVDQAINEVNAGIIAGRE